ncbi:hypothetical protein ScPMuIL_015914 [Solemya velum]
MSEGGFEEPRGDEDRAVTGLWQRLRTLIDNSALHGLPRVFLFRRWIQKVLWLCLFTAVFVLLVMQLNDLYIVFSAKPIKTTISLTYQPRMKFPAITICNLNPIRISKVDESVSPTLFDLVNTVTKPPRVRAKRETSNDSSAFWGDNPSILSEQNVNSDEETDDDFQKIGSMPLDTWYQLKQQIILEYASLPVTGRQEVGHQRAQLIPYCTVAGKECLNTSYSLLMTNLYGNCYTIQSSAYRAADSGPVYGISMTINLENHEFIEKYRRGYGARMVIHDQDSVPLPEENGITLSAGYETTIGLKMLKLERLGEPYGSCQDVKAFEKTFGLKYTRQICMLICEKESMLKQCGCALSDMYMDKLWAKLLKFDTAASCYSTQSMYTCAQSVKQEFTKGNFSCDCKNPCSETIYETTFSGRLWPTEKFTHTLKSDVCNKVYISAECQQGCAGAKSSCTDDCPDCPLVVLDNTTIGMNFLKILVYFQDLNFETISESPLYETSRFLADIGGAMGLFMGASVLGMLEVLDVIVEVLSWLKDLIARRRVGDRNPKEKEKSSLDTY